MLGSFLGALRRLSVLPVGESPPEAEGREGDQLVLFPAAGLALGAVPAAVLVAAALLRLPGFLPEVLAVAALAAVTGLRNLADLGRMAEAEIRRCAQAPDALPAGAEGPLGAAGAAAVTLALLVKFAALAGLRGALGGSVFGTALAIMAAACAARWAAVMLAGYSEAIPGRSGGSEDEALLSAAGGRELRWGLVFAALATFLVALVGFLTLGALRPLAALAAATLLGWAAAGHCRRRFGGACRECLGATIECAEVLALVTMCLLAPAGGGAAPARPPAAAAPARPAQARPAPAAGEASATDRAGPGPGPGPERP